MASETFSYTFSEEDIAAFDRTRRERDTNGRNWSAAFSDKDRLVLPLEMEAESVKSLTERLEAVLRRYNQAPKDGVTVIIDHTDDGKVVHSQNGQGLRRDRKRDSLANFLRTINDPEAWLVAHDWEMERDKRRRAGQDTKALDTPAGQRHVAFDEIKHDRPISCDGISSDSLRVVISRDPMDIARMSTGRRWTSCMAKGRENFHYVPNEIAAGSLVAYLVHKEDAAVDYPLMRVLLKPFRNDAGESILVPNLIYPKGVADNTATEAALRQVVNTFVRQQNQGRTGNFTMDPNIYTDGQETSLSLGSQQSTAETIAKGMAVAVQGKVIEYVTEIEAAHRKGNQAAARQYTQQLKRLYSDDDVRITHYLRSLRSVNVGQQLPQPETIREALGHPKLLDTLKSHEILTNLYILGGEDWNRYMQDQHRALKTLNLKSNPIGDAGAIQLGTNTTVTSLSIALNNIGDEGAEALAKNTTLTSLDLRYNQIGDAGGIALAKNTTLTSLDLGHNQIGASGAVALAKNTTLTSLDLESNKIGDRGAEALAKNTTLTSLGLCCNQIGDTGAVALAKNTTLTSLDLESNKIGDRGAEALAKNTTLTSLDLAANDICNAGAAHLAKNTSLTSLDLRRNQIGDEGAEALAKNTTITSLDLESNQIGDRGAEALAKNTSLTSLGLSGNQIGFPGVEALANNTTLTSLNLTSIAQIRNEGYEKLSTGLKKNKNLLEYKGPSEWRLADHIASNRKEALRIMQQLTTDPDHTYPTAKRREIAARANAIKQLLDQSKDLTQDQKTNAFGQLRDILSAVQSDKWQDRVAPSTHDRHRVRS